MTRRLLALAVVGGALAVGPAAVTAAPDKVAPGFKKKPKPRFRTVVETVNVFVNHETSLVPFPATLVDFTNAMVSQLVVNRQTRGIVSGRYAIPSSANFQRFCSNFIADREHGFSRPMLFTNEEATDLVNRTGNA